MLDWDLFSSILLLTGIIKISVNRNEFPHIDFYINGIASS